MEPYAQQPPDQHMQMKAGRGGLILAFGILSWVLCIIFGIMAWVMGNTDLAEMDAGRMDRTDRGLTQAGRVIGMISVLLVPVGIILAIMLAGGLSLVTGSR
jgi:hypothetical protein